MRNRRSRGPVLPGGVGEQVEQDGVGLVADRVDGDGQPGLVGLADHRSRIVSGGVTNTPTFFPAALVRLEHLRRAATRATRP